MAAVKVSVYRAYELRSGEPVYGVRYRDPSTAQLVRRVAGTKAEAELVASKLRLDLFRKKHSLQEESPGLTLADLRDRRLPRLKRTADRRELARFVAALGEGRFAASLTATDFERWVASEVARRPRRGQRATVSADTVNRQIVVVRAAFTEAFRAGLIPANPAATKLRMLEDGEPRQRLISDEEFERMMAATTSAEFRAAMVLARETAMRQGELFGMLRPDAPATAKGNRIDLERRLVFIPKPKEGKPKRVPLTRVAVETIRTLLEHPSEDGRLFTTTPTNASRRFAMVAKRAGVEGARFHDLRRTAAVRMRRAGIDKTTIKRIGGWSTDRIFEGVYQPYEDEELVAAVDRIDRSREG